MGRGDKEAFGADKFFCPWEISPSDSYCFICTYDYSYYIILQLYRLYDCSGAYGCFVGSFDSIYNALLSARE